MSKEVKEKILTTLKTTPLNKEIKKVSLFGSYLHGSPRADSDIDLLIEFVPSAKVGFFKLFAIQSVIEQNIGKKIDLLTPDSLSKLFKEQIIKEAEIIYER